jgi:hypothetical protein
MRTHESYTADLARDGKRSTSIFDTHALQLESVLGDVMHTMSLGIGGHLVGNATWEIMDQHFDGPQAQQVATMHVRLKKWYKDTKVDGKWTYAREKASGDWPKLKGKASATRRLVPFPLLLATEFNSVSLYDRLRLGACQALDRVRQILYEHPRLTSSTARAELVRLSQAFFDIYSKLSEEAVEKEDRAWRLSPKFHLFQHIVEHQSWVSRLAWVYADEDLQRILNESVFSCHSKTTAHTVLFKWAVTMFDS